MAKRCLPAAVLAVNLCFAAAALATPLPGVIKAVKPSIVGVGSYQAIRRPPSRLRGTGFVVADGRHVITNYHVLPPRIDAKAKEILAIFVGTGGAAKVRRVEKVAEDPAHDLVVLRLVGGPALPALALGGDTMLPEGSAVAFTGFPIGAVLGLYPATHRGIVSALTPIANPQPAPRLLDTRMVRRLQGTYDVYQLDATAYPGNSGSPLYGMATGRVHGIVSSVFVKESKENLLKEPSGITYAIPIRHARRLLKELGVLP